MDPISNANRTSLDEPTPAELEAGACLPREPEPLASRPADGPAPAVKTLVDKYSPSVVAAPRQPRPDSTSVTKSSLHPGIALSVGGNLAAGPGIAVGAEGSIGVVVGLSPPKISVFTSGAWGTALAPGVSAGISGQLSVVKDMTKFWGTGAERGLNLPRFGGAINYTTPMPGGPREFNGATGSVGPNLGGDAHDFEGTTTERGSMSWDRIKAALLRAILP